MELCNTTLKEFLSRIKRELNQNLNRLNFQTTTEFYISCEIFKEILEAIKYLHKLQPPIIHRDLKPSNILIKCRNDRFVKIGDFGLAKNHEFIKQSHTHYIGTPKYTAPEIKTDKSRYNTKADIYSLGVLSQRIFNIDDTDEDR
jgi:serine/threonine protein kinase